MLVNIHIPFSQAAQARRFAAFGDCSEVYVVTADTDKLSEAQRSHLMRMVSRGETTLSAVNDPVGALPHNVYLTSYRPEPEAARVTCRVHYLDPSLPGDAQLLSAINKGANEDEIVQLALAGDIERWRVALTITRTRLNTLVSAWRYETSSLIQRVHTLKDPLVIAQVRHCKVEPPQWFDEVVRSGDTLVLNLWRQLVEAFREARARLME